MTSLHQRLLIGYNTLVPSGQPFVLDFSIPGAITGSINQQLYTFQQSVKFPIALTGSTVVLGTPFDVVGQTGLFSFIKVSGAPNHSFVLNCDGSAQTYSLSANHYGGEDTFDVLGTITNSYITFGIGDVMWFSALTTPLTGGMADVTLHLEGVAV